MQSFEYFLLNHFQSMTKIAAVDHSETKLVAVEWATTDGLLAHSRYAVSPSYTNHWSTHVSNYL